MVSKVMVEGINKYNSNIEEDKWIYLKEIDLIGQIERSNLVELGFIFVDIPNVNDKEKIDYKGDFIICNSRLEARIIKIEHQSLWDKIKRFIKKNIL